MNKFPNSLKLALGISVTFAGAASWRKHTQHVQETCQLCGKHTEEYIHKGFTGVYEERHELLPHPDRRIKQ